MLPRPVNFTKQAARATVMVQQLQNAPYDVILFQEAFLHSFRKKMGQALKAEFPHQAFLNKSIRLFHFLNSGLFVASRYPFKILDHYYFTRCRHSDCYASKGVLLIEVSLPGGKQIQLAMTHTQAWDDNLAREIRLSQFQEIRELLNRHAVHGIPQVLAGDFNIEASSDDFKSMLRILEMENTPLSGELAHTSGFAIDCYKKPGGNHPQWIDHILLHPRDSAAVLINKRIKPFNGMLQGRDCALSDHHGIEAVIKL